MSDNDSDSLGSDSSRIEEEVLSGSVTRAASAFDTMLNAAISQLGYEFGSDLWSALTGKTSTDLARANLLMVADSRLILYKQLPTISSRLLDIYSHARLISSNTSSASSSLNSLLSLLKKQWGYGYGGTVVLESNSPAAWLSSISSNMTSKGLLKEDGRNIYRNVPELALYSANQLYDLNRHTFVHGKVGPSSSSSNMTIAELLLYAANRLYFSEGYLSDISAKLDNLKIDVSVSGLDLSYIEGKLDSILDLLRLGFARDVIDTLLGDLDFSRLASLSADVEGAISSAFPFCIPAVMKQVLGLLEYDGSAPVWKFDIAGSPLVCDFRDFQAVADVSGWVARIGFVLVLLANTRRFVFMGGGAVAE